MDVDASGGRIIGAYGNGKPGVAGNGDGAVGIGTQKDGFLGNHSLYRKPHMEGSLKTLRTVYTHRPDTGCGRLEAHENQLAAGFGLNELVVYSDSCSV